ncbi:MAG: hypothetical protein JWL81_1064 [Verrucomicrobiales bacterium]|nr:hypothetical protein [Verrucomicrobiales bacterium]
MKIHPTVVILTGFALGGVISATMFPIDPASVAARVAEMDNRMGRIHPEVAGPEKSSSHASFKSLLATGAGSVEQKLAMAARIMSAQSAQIPGLLELIPESDEYSRQLLLTRWVEVDAAAAGAWAGKVLSGLDGSPSPECMGVFTAWARKDPDAAMAMISQSAGTGRAVGFSYQVLAELLLTDPAAGVAFGAATPASTSVLNWHFSRDRDVEWLKKDPVKAAALLSALPPGEFRDGSLCRLIGILADQNFEAALALQLKIPGLQTPEYESEGRDRFFKEWARRDLAGMTAYVNDHATGAARLGMKAAIAAGLADSDPMTGLSWAAENLSGPARLGAVKDILTKLATSDPVAGRGYLETLPEGTALAAATTAFCDALPGKDHTAFLALAGSMPEGAARNRVEARAYQAWYAESPEAALEQLAKVPRENLPADFWTGLAIKAEVSDPPWKYLSSVPAGASSEYVGAFWRAHYVESGIERQAELLADLTERTDRAAALREMTKLGGSVSPEAMVKWAGTLPDPGERETIVEGLKRTLRAMPEKELEALLSPLR